MFDTLVTVDQALEGLASGGWHFVDCRFSLADPGRGRVAHGEGRIPGAYYAHLDEDLSGPPGGASGGRHPLPSPTAFADLVRRLGITTRQVVVYDDAGGRIAARLWWMLRASGHPAAAVLDGGWPAWRRAEGPVASGDVVDEASSQHGDGHREAAWTPGGWRGQVATIAEIEASVRGDAHGPVLLDARVPERFRGEREPIDPVAGHIPGARSMPCAANLEDDGRVLGVDALQARFEVVAGSAQDVPLVAYCGSGVTACHLILAAAIVGRPLPRLYPGSWSEWCADPARPIGRA